MLIIKLVVNLSLNNWFLFCYCTVVKSSEYDSEKSVPLQLIMYRSLIVHIVNY